MNVKNINRNIKLNVENMKRNVSAVALTCVCALGLAACADSADYSTDEIVNRVLEESNQIDAYYMETKMTTSIEGDSVSKEWHVQKDGVKKIRIETESEDGKHIAVNDGEQLLTYDVEANKATHFDVPELGMNEHLSAQEQIIHMLHYLQENYEVELEGTEQVLNRDTFHLTLTPKQEGDLISKWQLWIDQETWLILKSNAEVGDLQTSTEATQLDLNPDVEDSLFAIDLPDDVEVQAGEDLSDGKQIELEEVTEYLPGDFLYLESDEYELQEVNVTELEALNMAIVTLHYGHNEEPAFELTMIHNEIDEETEEEIDIALGEEIEIRGYKGEKTDLNPFVFYFWQEGGLNYNLEPIREIDEDEVLALTEQLEYYQAGQ